MDSENSARVRGRGAAFLVFSVFHRYSSVSFFYAMVAFRSESMTYPGINMHGPDFSLYESNVRFRSRTHSSKFWKKDRQKKTTLFI